MQGRDDHDAWLFRRSLESLLNNAGVTNVGDMLVTQRAAGANLSVDIAAGSGWTPGHSNVWGRYYIENDFAKNLIMPAVNATNDFICLVGAQVNDSEYSGVTDAWDFAYVAGTPAASPIAPAAPDMFLTLATVRVRKAPNTQILNSDITNVAQTITAKGQPVGILGAAKLAIQGNYNVVTTNSSGYATIPYPVAFPNQMITALVNPDGSGAGNTHKTNLYVQQPQNKTALTVIVYDNGVLKTNWTSGIWWIAAGN